MGGILRMKNQREKIKGDAACAKKLGKEDVM